MTTPTGLMRTWWRKSYKSMEKGMGGNMQLSKSGIVGNESKISETAGDQETPGPVQELIKVLTAALQAERKKIP